MIGKRAIAMAAGLALMLAAASGPALAHGFGEHHQGMSAMGPCIAVMSSSQRANLKQAFSSEKGTWQTDRQNVVSARHALVSAILSGSKDVSSQESALASAQQQLQKDKDSMAEQVCSQLNSTQLSAAQTLFKNMTALHANMRQQEKTYWQQAKAAAGNGQSQTGE